MKMIFLVDAKLSYRHHFGVYALSQMHHADGKLIIMYIAREDLIKAFMACGICAGYVLCESVQSCVNMCNAHLPHLVICVHIK